MKPIDYLKALGVAVAVLALNLLLTTLAITVYALAVAPGQPQAQYTAMAPEIGAWTGPVCGMALMFLAGWWFARRRPERPALMFIGVVWGAYLAIDAALGVAAGGAAAILTMNFAMSLGGALLAGLAGAASGPRPAP
jgi:hypothetical protein